MMAQRVLVLGANGFLGRRLMLALERDPHFLPIAGLRRATSHPQPGTECAVLDACDERQLHRTLLGCSAVINCVAGSAETIVDNAKALFAAARAAGSPRIVYLSSMSAYGSAEGDIDEQHRTQGDLGAYSAAKVEAESIAEQYPRSVILRPGCIYGPGSAQWSMRVAQWLRSGRLGDLGRWGDGYCNLVYIDDVIQAVIRSLGTEAALGQKYNLVAPMPPRWNEYFVEFAKTLGATPVRRISRRRLTVESKLLAVPLKLTEIATGKLGLRGANIPPAISPALLRLFRQEIRLLPQKAEAELGLHWTQLSTGLQRTADWLSE
jgi:nucleoside-diphosphate-sugar epimerase